VKPGVLLLNFGGPRSADELVPFLEELLSDVLPGPRPIKRLLGRLLAPRRAARVGASYAAIGWSPTVRSSEAQAEALRRALGPDAPPVRAGMMFTSPWIRDAVADLLGAGCDRLVAVGLFPHWSFATTAAAHDRVHEALVQLGRADVPVHYARAFFADPAYVDAVADTARHAVAASAGEGPIHLLFSAHGIPVSFVRRGDPYPEHVREGVRRVVERLGWSGPWSLSWQSRLGPVRWLGPDTVSEVRRLGTAGARRVVVVPVSFVGEHIETLHELDLEVAEEARHAGVESFSRAPALETHPRFVEGLAAIVHDALARHGSTSCVRCLVPKTEPHRRRPVCPDCGFRAPVHLVDGVGGVG
jgi:ferrochelatase